MRYREANMPLPYYGTEKIVQPNTINILVGSSAPLNRGKSCLTNLEKYEFVKVDLGQARRNRDSPRRRMGSSLHLLFSLIL